MSSEPATTRSPWWLAIRVFDEPAAVFEDLVRHPRALVPIVLLVVAAAVVAFGAPAATLERQAQLQAQAVRDVAGDRFTEEDLQKMVGDPTTVRSRAMTLAAMVVSAVVSLALVSVVFKYLLSATSGVDIGFGEEFAFAAYAFMPQLIGWLLALALMVFGGLDRSDFSLGFLFDQQSGTFLSAFAGQLTFFGAWSVFLLAVANQLKTRQRSVVGTLAIIAGLWIFVKVVVAGIGAAFLT